MSLYGSYSLSDRLTLKLDLPAAFDEPPYFQGFKAPGLYGMQNENGDLTFSGDLNLEYYLGEGWNEIIPTIGFNTGKRWGTFALLGRISGGIDSYTESGSTTTTAIGEAEIGPFVYTGEIGMIGTPLMVEYVDEYASVNIALDWEIYLPFNLSLWIVPRYEVRGESGFSVWTGIAWMHFKEE
jgi:hypothetical protein